MTRSSFQKFWSWTLAILTAMTIFQGMTLPVFADDDLTQENLTELRLEDESVPNGGEVQLNPDEDKNNESNGIETFALAPESIAVSPAGATVILGKTQQFAAAVIGEGASGDVIWSVEGNSQSTTTISADGLLAVSQIEGADKLTVKAVSAVDETVFGTATVTIGDLPFSTALSKNDLVLHYIFDQNDRGGNNIVKDYSPRGNDSYIRGNVSASQWNADGFQFLSANANYIELPASANLVSQRMTLVFKAAKTASSVSGNGVLFCGKTGYSGNGFWINNAANIFHNNITTPGSFGASSYGAMFAATNVAEEYAYSINASGSRTGFVSRNGAAASGSKICTDALTPVSTIYRIGTNNWAVDELLNNLRFSKYMIFNRDLSEAEVLEVYQGRLDPYKAELNDEVVSALARNADYYTPESMAAMRSARRAAVIVLKDASAGELEVSEALEALRQAVSELETVDGIINSVVVAPDEANVNLSRTQQFTVTVDAGSGISKAVVWSVDSEKSTITQNGLLTVALDEDQPVLTVKATSVVAPLVSGTAVVTVTDDPLVLSVSVSPKTANVLKGNTAVFEAGVVSVGGADETIAWSVNGTASSIDENGVLTVGANETLNTLTVTATATADPTKKDTATVNVYSVSGLTITPPAENPQKGRTRIFSATVAGTSLPQEAQEVTWALSGNADPSTNINAFGALYVSMDEQAATLQVTAVSVKDPSKSATVSVDVEEYKPDVLVPQNTYYNHIARNPETNAAYSTGVQIPDFKSAGTWNTVSTTSPNTNGTSAFSYNWTTATGRPETNLIYGAGGSYLYGDTLQIGGYDRSLRYASGTNPGAEFAIYDKYKYADIDFTSGMFVPTGGAGALVFRYQDYQNYYYLKVSPGSSNNIVLGKVVSGVDSVLRTGSASVTAGTFYSWYIRLKGNNITVSRNTSSGWRPSDYTSSRVATPFNNVTLDPAKSFATGYCGLWSVERNTGVNFNLIGIVSRDFDYTIQNDTFTLTSGSQGQLKSLTATGLAGKYVGNELSIVGNEDTSRLTMGVNKYLGEIKFRYRVGSGSTDVMANTGRSDDVREMSLDEENNKISVNYNSKSANTNGIKDFTVQEVYSVGTDPVSGDYVKFDILLKNTSASNITFRDIALPVTWNNHWQFDAAYTDFVTHGANHISYHGSYITVEVGGGGQDKFLLIPDNTTDAKLEYRRFMSQQDYMVNMPEEFYIYSAGIAAQTSNNINQSYLPNTSLVMAPGEEKAFSFKIFKAGDYVDFNDVLAEQSIATVVKPGMVTPIDQIVEVDLRSQYAINSIEDLTPFPSLATGINASNPMRAEFTRDEVKTAALGGDHEIWKIKFHKLGRNDITVNYGDGKKTVLQFWVVEGLQDAIQRRADFLMDQCWISDARYTEITSASGTSTLKTYVTNHKYSFLEVNNVTGVAKVNGGNSDHCNDNNHEQLYDGPLFLAMKNAYYPVKREMEALEKYFIDLVYEKEIRKFGTTQSTGNGSTGHEGTLWHGCCNIGYWPDATGTGSAGATLSSRTFNYIEHASAFYGMYKAMKANPDILANPRWEAVDYLKVAAIVAYRGTSRSGSTGQMCDMAVSMIYAALLEEAAAGNEGTVANPSGTGGRTYRSCSNLADLLQTVGRTKGNNMTNRDFPFGSEFAFDNTGEEGAYFFAKDFATNANRFIKMKQTVDKTMAWVGKVPAWYLQATGRPMGNDWWMFQYATGLQGQLINDWYFNYSDQYDTIGTEYAGTGQFSQDIWRLVYPFKIASFIHIQSGQPELPGPTSGVMATPAADRPLKGVGVLGSNWGNYKPTRPYNWNTQFPYNESAESDITLWAGLNILSADVVPNDPSFGLAGYGCEVTDSDTFYNVIPQDGLFRRLNVVGDKFQMELLNDRYTAASIRKDYKGVSVELENARGTAHTGTVSIRGLAVGTYNVRADGELLGTVEVTNSNAQTKFTYTISAADVQTLRIMQSSVDDDGDDSDHIISVAVSPKTADVMKGASATFTETVRMKNTGGTMTGTVTWSVAGGTSADTKIVDGVLTAGADETAAVLTVTATSDDDATKSDSAAVNVYAITGVSITNAAPEAAKGRSLQLSAEVAHVNAPEAMRLLNWSVEGGVLGTTIDASGLLSVSLTETAETLTVKAASAADPAKFDTVTVTIVEASLAGDLVLHYAFDGSGTSGAIKDYSRNRYDTTINGTIGSNSWSSEGFAFASGNNIKLPNATLVSPQMTIIFKIKRTSASFGTCSFFWGKNASAWDSDGMFINNANGLTVFHNGTATSWDLGSTPAAVFPQNQWIEVAYSIDTTGSSSTGVLMINGVRQSVSVPTDAKLTNPSAPTNSIGITGYDNEPLTGITMSKYMIFDRALSEAEMIGVYGGILDPVHVAGVTLDKDTLELIVGASGQLTAAVVPEKAVNKAVRWNSSNETVATVDENGNVSALAGGTATITVTTVDGGFADTCTVNVSVPVAGVSLDQKEITLAVGQSQTLTATITPENATNKAVTWISSDGNIAAVNETGEVTAVAPGKATIFVRAEDGNLIASCVVNTTLEVTSIKINSVATTTVRKSKTLQLAAIFTPANANVGTEVTWSSSNEASVKVNAETGLITGVKAGGSARVTATTSNGKTYTITVTVDS